MCIRQVDILSKYIEKFDDLVHQILAHDSKFSSATITNWLIDGLKDEIKVVVLVHRSSILDTSIALLHEETFKDTPRREYMKGDSNSSFKYSGRT